MVSTGSSPEKLNGWQQQSLEATPAQMGFLGAAGFASFFLIGLLAGVWFDRLPRRTILTGVG